MLAFVVIAMLAVMSPGADTLLVVRAVLERGTRAGLWTTAGICSGCLLHATFSAAGLSLLLVQSPPAYDVLRLAGAAYLFYLGTTALFHAWKASVLPRRPHPPLPESSSGHTLGYRDGFVVNALNPKVSLFYLALVPQFVDPNTGVVSSYAVLTGIHIALGAAWFTALSFVLGSIREWLLAANTRRMLDALAGVVMIALALHTALASS